MRQLMLVVLATMLAPLGLAQERRAPRQVEGWRSARWGMTQDAVLALMPNGTRVTQPSGQTLISVPDVVVGQRLLHAGLIFENGGLTWVSISTARNTAADPDLAGFFEAAEFDLVAEYGPGRVVRKDSTTRQMAWELGPTVLTLVELNGVPEAGLGLDPKQPALVMIEYRQRHTH